MMEGTPKTLIYFEEYEPGVTDENNIVKREERKVCKDKENFKIIKGLKEGFKAGRTNKKTPFNGSQGGMYKLGIPGTRPGIIIQQLKEEIYVVLSVYEVKGQNISPEKVSVINDRANIIAARREEIYMYAKRKEKEESNDRSAQSRQ